VRNTKLRTREEHCKTTNYTTLCRNWPNSFAFRSVKHRSRFLLSYLLIQPMIKLHQQLLCKLQSRTVDTPVVEYLHRNKII